ncbi:DUF2690 domain-containing protein [Streptomyces sp. bgisy153]|uniref:helix-turn-helix domain-containing protein n=1 Tax=Streptomyces sp. bgisy153 TaxID=3413793 RepID=UPI003D7274E3
MPRWTDLPDEPGPQVREFAVQLRRVVDRSGLSVSAVADRTGYDRASWERYLDGRSLAPEGAVLALAEVTGADPARLTALREPAARARSHVETHGGGTAEATWTGLAAAPRGEFGPAEGAAPAPRRPGTPTPVRPGVAGPAGVPPAIPGPAAAPRARADGTTGGGRRGLLFLTATAGVLVIAAGAFWLTDGGPGEGRAGAPAASPSPAASPGFPTPPGVGCGGPGCEGKDAEAMGCGGALVVTAKSATVRTTLVEVRYSAACGAAWARITQAGPGDVVQVAVGAVRRSDTVRTLGDTSAYTPMVAVDGPAQARACVTLASGQKGCTP